MSVSTLVESLGGSYGSTEDCPVLKVGDRIQIQAKNFSVRRQYLANATGEIKALTDNKASVLLDEPANKAYKPHTVKVDLCFLKLIYVAEWEQVSLLQELSQEESNCVDSAKLTLSAVTDCAIASPVSPSTPTCANCGLSLEPPTLSPHHLPANRLQLKGNVWEVPTSETVSLRSCDTLEQANLNSSFSKTCLDCYQLPLFLETNPAHIFGRSSGSFMAVGTMRNGLLLEQPNTVLSGQEKGSCLLPRPGALSWSGNGRPPGTTKSEAKAKNLGILHKNEVYNPDWLELQFGLPLLWTSPQECRAATELLAEEGQHLETVSTIGLLKSPSRASFTSTPSSLKAISLWQPWASLIPLGLKHYETRSWKTSYRGKLLICSAAKLTKEQYQQYLKICNEVKLPAWDETNFPRGCAIAICDLVDCIEMTPCFIEQQSKTEILCGDWQPGRYAWKLENIQPIREPFAVKGKQGLFNISQDIFQSQQELTELLGDNQINPSNDEVLGDIENSPSKNISPSNQSPSKLLGDMGIRPELSEVLGDIEVNPSKEALEIDPSNEISPSKMRRHKGEGSGSIHWRNITKNGKDYPQAYYHWKENGQKKTKYIPKKLLLVIQEAEAAKRPVIEILALLGTAASPSKLLGDMGIRPELSEVLGDIEISPSKEALEIDPSNEISPSKMRRHKGEGSGSIHWRNITKNGKDYPQAYYHYEVWEGGDRLIKSSRYIPKRLLTRVQELEQYKAPVREILTLLGINL